MRDSDWHKVSRDLREIKRENFEHFIIQSGGNETYGECKNPKYENRMKYDLRRVIANLHRAKSKGGMRSRGSL